MKLVRNKDELSDFVIYELSEEESLLVEKKFGHKATFYVSPGEFCNYYMEKHSFADIIKEKLNVSPFYYAGFFPTYLEAYYHIKLIEATDMIDQMEWRAKKAAGIEPQFDIKNHRLVRENTDKLNVMFYPLTEAEPDPDDHPEFLI